MIDKVKLVQILKSSIKVWNTWRTRNPGTRLDLSEADLRCANLRDANLSDANLSDADLSEADLCGANLCGADLRWAVLYQVNLSDANLRDANLSDADLSEADLNGTDLRGANLNGTKFNWANLREANGVAVLFRDPRYEKEGYQLVAWTSEGEPWFNSGCCSFNKKDALEHWGDDDYADKERGAMYSLAIHLKDND
jgi:hypothetical protein